jgi:hypothetical protein
MAAVLLLDFFNDGAGFGNACDHVGLAQGGADALKSFFQTKVQKRKKERLRLCLFRHGFYSRIQFSLIHKAFRDFSQTKVFIYETSLA